MSFLDPETLRTHRWTNRIHSLLILAGMALLLSLMGWLLGGKFGALWALVLGFAALVMAPRLSPRLVLRAYGARPIHPREAPQIYEILGSLARKAGLERVPSLHYIPSQLMNAFAVGRRQEASIALTDGLLRRLELRELVGVLAHEMSHILHNDTWIMGLADTVSRLTNLASQLGWLLLLLSLPMALLGLGDVPLLAPLVLLAAPALSALLQLALSRTREFDADLGAAQLTGDPAGLASALAKLECGRGSWWERLFFPGRREPDPAILRTHPAAQERIRRLLELTPIEGLVLPPQADCRDFARLLPEVLRRPRWHVTGLWH